MCLSSCHCRISRSACSLKFRIRRGECWNDVRFSSFQGVPLEMFYRFFRAAFVDDTNDVILKQFDRTLGWNATCKHARFLVVLCITETLCRIARYRVLLVRFLGVPHYENSRSALTLRMVRSFVCTERLVDCDVIVCMCAFCSYVTLLHRPASRNDSVLFVRLSRCLAMKEINVTHLVDTRRNYIATLKSAV